MLYLSYYFQPEVNTWIYLRKAITLQADSFHNLDPRQMICISFEIHNLYWCITLYWKLKKIAGLSFSKLSFKVASAYMLPQSSNICLQKVVIYMLNKNTWGVKSARPIRSNITNRHVRPKILISAEAKKLLYQNYFQLIEWHTIVYSIFSQVWLALSLGHLFSYLNVIKVAKWQSQSYLWKYAINYCMSFN